MGSVAGGLPLVVLANCHTSSWAGLLVLCLGGQRSLWHGNTCRMSMLAFWLIMPFALGCFYILSFVFG